MALRRGGAVYQRMSQLGCLASGDLRPETMKFPTNKSIPMESTGFPREAHIPDRLLKHPQRPTSVIILQSAMTPVVIPLPERSMHTSHPRLFTCVVIMFGLWTAHLVRADDPPSGVSAQTSLAQLSFVGLPADRLLASGLSSPQILAAAQRLRDAAAQLESLDAALRQLATAQSQVRAFEAEAAGGGSNESTAQALAAARAAVQTIEGQVATLRSALRAIVLADASPEQQALLGRALAGAKIGIDGALALAASTEAQHRQLAVALQAESRSQRLGEEIDPDYLQLLADARAQPQVNSAATRLNGEWTSLRLLLSTPAGGGQP